MEHNEQTRGDRTGHADRRAAALRELADRGVPVDWMDNLAMRLFPSAPPPFYGSGLPYFVVRLVVCTIVIVPLAFIYFALEAEATPGVAWISALFLGLPIAAIIAWFAAIWTPRWSRRKLALTPWRALTPHHEDQRPDHAQTWNQVEAELEHRIHQRLNTRTGRFFSFLMSRRRGRP